MTLRAGRGRRVQHAHRNQIVRALRRVHCHLPHLLARGAALQQGGGGGGHTHEDARYVGIKVQNHG